MCNSKVKAAAVKFYFKAVPVVHFSVSREHHAPLLKHGHTFQGSRCQIIAQSGLFKLSWLEKWGYKIRTNLGLMYC